jgi:protein-tyrosine phosphatase
MTRRVDVRTSSTHPLRIDWLDAPAPVGMTLAPGVHGQSTDGFRWQRDLDADLARLRDLGATMLVCLMEDHEFARYAIDDLPVKARAHGLALLRLAIPDCGVPRSFEAVDALLDAVEAHAAQGGRLVVHCRGGLGRTGTIAGCYLVRHGTTPTDALAMLRRARKTDRCPEFDEQRAFIARYAEHLRRRQASSGAAPAAQSAPRTSWRADDLPGLLALDATLMSPCGPRAAADLLARVETEVARAPERCFGFDAAGNATLSAAGRTFNAGRFTTVAVDELRARLASRARAVDRRILLSVLHGAHPAGDIGTLQATASPGTLFQVASQFNCLEATGPFVARVRDYVGDSTQGPRASVSALAGTFLRHYAAPAPDGGRFVQTDRRCINLLEDVFGPSVAELRCGYLQTSHVRDMDALASALAERFGRIRVGVHAGVEVVFGHDWSGPVPGSPRLISQVFTSTMALGGYSRDDGGPALADARRHLLRGAYLGTLLAAIDLGCETIVLTLVGGGVFGNPIRDIWDAIDWAVAQAEPFASGTTHVVVNTRAVLHDEDRARVRTRGGTILELRRSE